MNYQRLISQRQGALRQKAPMFSRDTFDETMDPYCFSDRHWIDDIRQWLAVDFPAIYTHLIDTPGGYTREKLKAFKSLEAHNQGST